MKKLNTLNETEEERDERDLVLIAAEKHKLPAPRLQFTWRPLTEDWGKRECLYSVVIPLQAHDIRRERGDDPDARSEWHAVLGITVVDGGGRPVLPNGEVNTPYRDGAHAIWDNEHLGNLPIYAVCGKYVHKIKVKAKKV